MNNIKALSFYEFFAGGGMARLGLGDMWECLFANDICITKGETYKSNFHPADELLIEDIKNVKAEHLPNQADLAWASFPCQDLSLAGNNGGIHAPRSGTFWYFADILKKLKKEKRNPPLVVIENVIGLISSQKGSDFIKVISTLEKLGYKIGPLVIDAVHFVPQSRPRLFIVCVRKDFPITKQLVSDAPIPSWNNKSINAVYNSLPPRIKNSWIWWNLPIPHERNIHLKDLIEEIPTGVKWHTKEETKKLLSMMTPLNLSKVKAVQDKGVFDVGSLYKRTRKDKDGKRVQRAEVRFDGIAGCLRTPAGGSSRQLILTVEGKKIRSRLLSPREAARLMGVPDWYKLPQRYNDAYKVMGDGLAVPAVSWLEQNILRPLLAAEQRVKGAA